MGLIKISELELYDTNSRRTTNGETLEELAQSIDEVGLINPLTVIQNGSGYKVIAGQRRLKALRLTDRTVVDCKIMEGDLSDEEILEIQITENAQREDVHPLEEVSAINTLMKGHSLVDVATRLGKSERHIKQLRKLNGLSKEMRALFMANAMVLSQAFVFAQFSKEVQDDNLDAFDMVQDNEGNEVYYLNYTPKDLKHKIKSSSRPIDLAPFDPADKSLALKDLGACGKCKFNSTAGERLFEDDAIGKCLNPDCFDHKLERDLKIKVNAAKKEYPELVGLALNSFTSQEEYAGMKVFTADEFEKVNPEDATTHTKTAIIIEGSFSDPSDQGTIVWMNRKKSDKVVDHSDETPLEGDARKMDKRHERLLRKASIIARRNIFDQLIQEPEPTATTVMRTPILDRILSAIATQGDQKVLREWSGLGESRLQDHQFVEALRKAKEYPETINDLNWLLLFIFGTDMLGSKYQADRVDAKDSFIKFAKDCGVNTGDIIKDALYEAKITIAQDKKDLKEKIKVDKDMQDRYAAIVQNASPVELIKGTIWRVGDVLPDDLTMTKRVCRKFGLKAPATATNEDLHKALLDRFNELRRRTI